MKSQFPASVLIVSVLGLVVGAIGARVNAQPSLGIQMHAGLTITGAVGMVYSIEYTVDLGETNTTDSWRCLEFLRLPANPFLWIDQTAPAATERLYRAVEFVAPTNTLFIPPGTFRMGSPSNELDRFDWEGPPTAVTIRRGFWMGIHEVTQGEYEERMGNNPSAFPGNDRHPVEQVSWDDAQDYCAALTEHERAAGRIPINAVYRLPTEAEWEYACRAWTSTRFSHGDDPGYQELSEYAWHWHNSGLTTQPVGQKLPNPWGLHDLHGNVWEWCQDGWSEHLPGGTVVDPWTPATGPDRVLRGGGWSYEPKNCRSASRSRAASGDRFHGFGFRIVLAAGSP
jgi:formylglycine-generating enzyme required for sulfatase activity